MGPGIEAVVAGGCGVSWTGETTAWKLRCRCAAGSRWWEKRTLPWSDTN